MFSEKSECEIFKENKVIQKWKHREREAGEAKGSRSYEEEKGHIVLVTEGG